MGDGEASAAFSDGVGVTVGGTAGGLADGTDNLVESRVEGLILVGRSLELEGERIGSRAERLEVSGLTESLRVFSRGVNFDEGLSSTRGVGNLEDHVHREGGTLGTLGRRNCQRGDRSLGVVVDRAHLHRHAHSDGIGVQLRQQGRELLRMTHVARQKSEIEEMGQNKKLLSDHVQR